MFVLTTRLVDHAVKAWGLDGELAKDATKNADAINAHLMQCVDDGKAKLGEIKELSSESSRTRGEELLEKTITAANAPLVSSIEMLVKALSGNGVVTGGDGATLTNAGAVNDPPQFADGVGKKAYAAAAIGGAGSEVSGQSQEAADMQVRVKSVKERFSIEKRFLSLGDSVQTKSLSIPGMDTNAQRSFNGMSDLDKAVIGATMKYLVNRAAFASQVRTVPHWAKMTDLDHHLMEYAAHELEWSGPVGMRGSDDAEAVFGYAKNSRLNGIQTKAVLDDATSGGLEAVPIVFDDAAIITPLLTSELLPLVDIRTTTRRRVEAFRIANPSMYWTAEGTAPTTFNTANFIGELNTTIHPCVGWMDIGMDFEEDSPVAMGNLILERYGVVARVMLENAIAAGTGTGQPLGVLNTPGATTVDSTNADDGPVTVDDYEALLFAIPKAFRAEAGNRMAFMSNEANYRKSRSIAVGTNDQRRVFGMTHEDYQLLNKPYRLNESIPAVNRMVACLNRYVLYRRAGFDVRTITEDADLAIKNQMRLVVRQRWGGQMNHAKAVAIIDDTAA